MRNLKIGVKLTVTFAIILGMFAVTVGAALFGLIDTGNKFEGFYTTGYPVSAKTIEIRFAVQKSLKALSQSMLTEDKQLTESFVEESREAFTLAEEGMDFVKEHYEGDETKLNQAIVYLDGIAPVLEQARNLASQNKNDEATALLLGDLRQPLLDFQAMMAEIDTATAEMAAKDFQASEKAQMFLMILVIAVSAAAFGVTCFLAVYITRQLTKPIKEIESVASEMAEGKLGVTLSYESRDELGSLCNNIRRMTERIQFYMRNISDACQQMASGDLAVKNTEDFAGDFRAVQLAIRELVNSLNSTLSSINQASDQVAAGSDQVSSGAQALSQGATEQASAVEELAATINEISSQVSTNAEDAQGAQEAIQLTTGEIQSCNTQMSHLKEAMDDINEKSQEISKIIKTIEDIAFQTNILALNAAVEAARAGEAGKGFAVVADEVRNLASKSAEASKNTAALIESSIRAVENGNKIADATAESLTRVVSGAGRISEAADRIAEASHGQADSILQVTQGIDQISSVVQTNSATAEESAAASEELSGQAATMRNLVGRFKLRD